ncbi:hypothetical protein JOF28_000296 [Leucobacter exalbidus]|uniref:Uncharacterized protein n=1 Tax=Leucobacter exalbidus TaxID=662960 RepID=A0A940T2X2_9MICO|nr:hypothetical protein [Leucobacter exalbidus]MBP1325064.1 hypothetical protein [Leucobacter exalbidus]
MSNETRHDGPTQPRIENVIRIDGGRDWGGMLITLLATAGIMAIGYQLSLGPFADVVATGMTVFLVTLVGYLFKAGIWNLPPSGQDSDDLAFTKSTLRRIYDEIQTSIARSGVVKLIIFAALYTAGFLFLKAGMGVLFGLLSGTWMAIGVGLLFGAGLIAQKEILAWLRKLNTKKGRK